MNSFIKFFHELMNPHCAHCADQRDIELEHARDINRCRSCESLERQLSVLNQQNNDLISKLTKSNEQPIPVASEVTPKPLRRGPIPFNLIRQQLEQESRHKAAAMKNAALPDSEITKAEIANPALKEDVEDLENLVMNANIAKSSATGIKQ